jgi:Flp pilus assembly pilin Flp
MFIQFFSRLWRDNRGQDLVEYALLAAFVATMAAAIIPNWYLGPLSQIMSSVTSSLIVGSLGS